MSIGSWWNLFYFQSNLFPSRMNTTISSTINANYNVIWHLKNNTCFIVISSVKYTPIVFKSLYNIKKMILWLYHFSKQTYIEFLNKWKKNSSTLSISFDFFLTHACNPAWRLHLSEIFSNGTSYNIQTFSCITIR